MMTTLRIPRAAMPVVRVLRREVRRPSPRGLVEDALRLNDMPCPRWSRARWRDTYPPDGFCCPLGLLPDARLPAPVRASSCGLPDLLDHAAAVFVGWWDYLSLADARRAVDLIWSPKRRRNAR